MTGRPLGMEGFIAKLSRKLGRELRAVPKGKAKEGNGINSVCPYFIYITFEARDDKGGLSSGFVTVGVPHDQGMGKVPVNDGPLFDSTQ